MAANGHVHSEPDADEGLTEKLRESPFLELTREWRLLIIRGAACVAACMLPLVCFCLTPHDRIPQIASLSLWLGILHTSGSFT